MAAVSLIHHCVFIHIVITKAIDRTAYVLVHQRHAREILESVSFVCKSVSVLTLSLKGHITVKMLLTLIVTTLQVVLT